jgi:uncharacterized UPF0146 family protein
LERGRLINIVDYIVERYKRVAEIGIGNFTDVAILLKDRGVEVIATDIKYINCKGLRVIVDDLLKPDLMVYKGVQLLYSLRPPVELVPYIKKLAKDIFSDLIIKPLSSDILDGSLVNWNGLLFYFWSKYDIKTD